MPLTVGEKNMVCMQVSVGNPHAVFFTQNVAAVPISELGPKIEHDHAFPDGVNAEFVQVIGDHELRMRVWERGSGVTMACGTGACASAVAAVVGGYCSYNSPIIVHLDGGDLTIQVADNRSVTMSGPAEFVYEGDTEICLHRT